MIRFNFHKLMVVLMVVISPSVFANDSEIMGALSTSVGDTAALTVSRASAGNGWLAGFYISTIYTASNTCTGSSTSNSTGANQARYNFSVPTYTVALNSSTVIGGSALYATLAKTYNGLTTSSFPFATSNMSVQIAMFEDINYQSRLINGARLLKTTSNLSTTACFVLTCINTPAYTCTATVSNGVGSTAYY